MEEWPVTETVKTTQNSSIKVAHLIWVQFMVPYSNNYNNNIKDYLAQIITTNRDNNEKVETL